MREITSMRDTTAVLNTPYYVGGVGKLDGGNLLILLDLEKVLAAA